MDESNREVLFLSKLQFCEFNKPLLVEEIALADHPAYIHYGKCSVIGKIAFIENSLESLHIPDLPEELQLADSTCSIQLHLECYHGPIVRASHVEVTGIVKLQNTTSDFITDSEHLRNTLLMHTDRSKFKQEFEAMINSYRPFIEVNDIRTVAKARELIACNLKMRMLSSFQTK